ncbi:truncated transcription factor CAULIFLOWER A-like protein, partial [Tanacetum coccineum]
MLDVTSVAAEVNLGIYLVTLQVIKRLPERYCATLKDSAGDISGSNDIVKNQGSGNFQSSKVRVAAIVCIFVRKDLCRSDSMSFTAQWTILLLSSDVLQVRYVDESKPIEDNHVAVEVIYDMQTTPLIIDPPRTIDSPSPDLVSVHKDEAPIVEEESQEASWTLESSKLRVKTEVLERNIQHYGGEDQEPLSPRDLQNVEQQLETTLKRIRTKKSLENLTIPRLSYGSSIILTSTWELTCLTTLHLEYIMFNDEVTTKDTGLHLISVPELVSLRFEGLQCELKFSSYGLCFLEKVDLCKLVSESVFSFCNFGAQHYLILPVAIGHFSGKYQYIIEDEI